MPEGLEAELYRRAAADVTGRVIDRVDVDPRQPAAHELALTLPGRRVAAVRRHGKLVLLDLADGPPDTLGLHFGMTGRLVVDEVAPIEALEYSSARDDPAWDRLVVAFTGGGVLRVNDPRRWARFTIDPDITRLGVDVFELTSEHLAAAFARRRASVKAVLLDQSVVAGFGNLCVDEVLWHAGVSPVVSVSDLGPAGVERIVESTNVHLPAMLRRGGSHRGTIDPGVRAELPPCPADGAPLRRERVGGRTTVWCPLHQNVA
ncbi:MAG: Fpg/Nei family DNA glycosylase [Ilumatobacter sp.]|nr:Fpg/Nei family DNA glycosylase [Ilumatobacter sp.]